MLSFLNNFFPGRRGSGFTFADLAPPFLRSRHDLALREMTLINYDIFCRRLTRELGTRHANSMDLDELRGLIRSHSRDYAEHVLTLLRWAAEKNLALWADDDPRDWSLPRAPRADETAPACLSPGEAHRFYAAVEPQFKPAFALGFFGGLRPYEICRLTWACVNIAERRIKIPASVSKTRRARMIEGVPTILWAELARSDVRTGPFIPPASRRGGVSAINAERWIDERAKAAEKAHVTLAHDVIRHTFATYFVALTGDPGKAAKILGHYDLLMLAAHYDGVRSKAEAEEYFHPRPQRALPWGGA